MSAIDLILATELDKETGRQARVELAQLRATIAEQARQLEEARSVIAAYRSLPTGPKGYTSYPLFDLHNSADDWLSANANAPQAEQGRQLEEAQQRIRELENDIICAFCGTHYSADDAPPLHYMTCKESPLVKQLEEARGLLIIINWDNYDDWSDRVDAWLAANPAPVTQEEQGK